MWVVVCLSIILCLGMVGIHSVSGTPSNPEIFLKGSVPYGVPYEDWIAKWWQWNLQIPKEQHPIVNDSLTTCPVGESRPVSFLTQKLQGQTQYSCTIPSGHAILAPIGTGECTTDEAKTSVPEEMINCATTGDKFLTINTVSIDGVPLNDLEQSYVIGTQMNDLGKNYAITKIFNITIPENNFLELKPGKWKDAAGGYFIFLKPLSPGDHAIRISAKVNNPLDPTYNYNYDTKFLLKVQ